MSLGLALDRQKCPAGSSVRLAEVSAIHHATSPGCALPTNELWSSDSDPSPNPRVWSPDLFSDCDDPESSPSPHTPQCSGMPPDFDPRPSRTRRYKRQPYRLLIQRQRQQQQQQDAQPTSPSSPINTRVRSPDMFSPTPDFEQDFSPKTPPYLADDDDSDPEPTPPRTRHYKRKLFFF
nr:AP2-associated protein kinase 1-like [Procambarus clarkii]